MKSLMNILRSGKKAIVGTLLVTTPLFTFLSASTPKDNPKDAQVENVEKLSPKGKAFPTEKDSKIYSNRSEYWDMQVNTDYLQRNQGAEINTDYLQTRENIDESDIMIPYKQPNDDVAVSYGSGDVNQDNIVNSADYNEMVNNQIQNDWADIDGNGIPSEQADIDLLYNYLTENIDYLPGHWNSLTTPQERLDWASNMLVNVDVTDTIPYVNGNVEDRWISGNYSTQIYLNFFGYDGDDIHAKYDQSNIGRFNLPVYKCLQYDPNTGMGHGINFVLVGEDPTNIYDWAYIEPQSDQITRINDTILGNLPGLRLVVNGIQDFSSISSPDMPPAKNIIGFDIDSSGVAVISYQNDNLITSRPSDMPIVERTLLGVNNEENNISTSYNLGQNYPNPCNSSTIIPYTIEEKGHVKLDILDMTGRRLETVVNEVQDPGKYGPRFNNSKYASGSYIYELKSGDKTEYKIMTILK